MKVRTISSCFWKLTRAIYPKLPENNMQFLVNYTSHEPTFRPNQIQKAFYLFPFCRTFPSIKYLIKLKWWIHCSSNSLLFRCWTAKLLIIWSCSIFVLQSQLTEFSGIMRQQHVSAGFSPKIRPRTKAITNNCPLFVWQNHFNFTQNVIRLQTCDKEHSLNPIAYGILRRFIPGGRGWSPGS